MTRVRSHLTTARRRLRARGPAIMQTAVAALAAWWLSRALVPDPRPAFAAIAAVITPRGTYRELTPGSGVGFEPNRIFEALIGGAVALAVGALLFPPDPALHVGRAAQSVLAELGRALERLAAALASGKPEPAERALAEARGIDRLVDDLDAALAVGRETVRTAPQRF